MSNPIVEFIKNRTIRRNYILKLINDEKKGYLYQSGWINSFKQRKPVDRHSNPIPWLSLPIVHFLQDRLSDDMLVFEYGSGNSTLFFAPQVAKVVSVEHDKEWYEYLQGQLPSNTSLHFEQLQPDGSYCRKASSTGEQYHMIIVDGRDRVNCCKQAINALAPNGVLLLDDSQREKYQGGLDFMKEQGFKKLDFWGLGPGSIWNKNTTLFYKANNCLNI